MRLANPYLRVLLSAGLTLLFAAMLVVPGYGGGFAARAKPLQQQGSVTLTVDDDTKAADQNQTVNYVFTVVNNTANNETFSISVSTNFDFVLPQGNQVTAGANGGTSQFTVGIRPGSGDTPGTVDSATVSIRSTTTSLSAQLIITTTVTVNGATPTNTSVPTSTTTPTITTTPTGTAGPTATPGPLCRDRFEPDGDIGSAKEIRPDSPQDRRAICPSGDEDFAFFGGVDGKVYTIDVSQMTNGLDLSLSLYDASGNLLAFNDDFPRTGDQTSNDNIRPRIQSFRVPGNGLYYIKVRDDAGRGGTDLSYTLELQSESYGPTPTQVAELCNDLFEPDGVPERARDIVVRERQPNRRLCPTGDADWVRFFAKASERYVIRVDSSRTPAGADPVLVLVDRDGASIISFNDDSDNTLDPRIEFQPEVDGFYYGQIKNVGDVGNQFIAYDLIFEPLGAGSVATPTGVTTTTPEGTTTPTTTGTATTPTTTGTATTPTTTGTATTPTGTTTSGYPGATQTAVIAATRTAQADTSALGGVKGAPAFRNGPAQDFVDPALRNVWSRTDQVIAERKADRSWTWGPTGLVARAEVYTQAIGGVRQVQYFDKARMEITDWQRDRNNPWFVTNGLLVKELIEGQMQLGDNEFVPRAAANVNVAGDGDDPNGPTYASFKNHLARAGNRSGQTANATLARNGSTGTTSERPAARLVQYVDETGHNIPDVFWNFLNARGPVGDGSRSDVIVDWVFAMGYPVSEPYWTTVRVGGVEKDVLVQAFQRRVLTYTPSNPPGWQVEMGNVGRHYYQWRYGEQP